MMYIKNLPEAVRQVYSKHGLSGVLTVFWSGILALLLVVVVFWLVLGTNILPWIGNLITGGGS